MKLLFLCSVHQRGNSFKLTEHVYTGGETAYWIISSISLAQILTNCFEPTLSRSPVCCRATDKTKHFYQWLCTSFFFHHYNSRLSIWDSANITGHILGTNADILNSLLGIQVYSTALDRREKIIHCCHQRTRTDGKVSGRIMFSGLNFWIHPHIWFAIVAPRSSKLSKFTSIFR